VKLIQRRFPLGPFLVGPFLESQRPCFEREFIPPNDPVIVQRVSVGKVETAQNTWEVRIFDPSGPFHVYFVGQGLLHLQLWNAFHRVSILTPSRRTRQNFEAFPPSGWKFTSHSYDELSKALESSKRINIPPPALTEALCASYAAEPERPQEKHLSTKDMH
tara:strand:+ start:41 stop:523 length:483 start_codon:yes stop_codon:yes gene_type:complete